MAHCASALQTDKTGVRESIPASETIPTSGAIPADELNYTERETTSRVRVGAHADVGLELLSGVCFTAWLHLRNAITIVGRLVPGNSRTLHIVGLSDSQTRLPSAQDLQSISAIDQCLIDNDCSACIPSRIAIRSVGRETRSSLPVISRFRVGILLRPVTMNQLSKALAILQGPGQRPDTFSISSLGMR